MKAATRTYDTRRWARLHPRWFGRWVAPGSYAIVLRAPPPSLRAHVNRLVTRPRPQESHATALGVGRRDLLHGLPNQLRDRGSGPLSRANRPTKRGAGPFGTALSSRAALRSPFTVSAPPSYDALAGSTTIQWFLETCPRRRRGPRDHSWQ
ncbi:hypothetical protein B296_00018477 [Ensete ventricosum]|uniref:Uncharacterized protein n=1 Tax=Ensete ventricosum TaxID=4639 RepID=A0A426ZSD8_ENSVE|nr:hypothetical protein B296_00018477 [Ensete ventricosum]